MPTKILQIIAIGATLLGCVPATNPDKTQSTAVQSVGDWKFECSPQRIKANICFMYQPLFVGKQIVAEARIMKLLDGRQAAAGVDVWMPQGTLLTSGVVMKVVGEKPKRYPIVICGSSGCLARFGLTKARLATYKASDSILVTIRAGNEPQKDITMVMSASGFTEAYAKLVAVKVPEGT